MPEPKIIFNSLTGSDTQASGAGPATALFGSSAGLNSSTSVNLSADNPNLAGVATDGSACLWVLTPSGRQFAKITAVNNTTKVVTVALAYGVTGAYSWAIGGKRATLDNASSRTLFGAGSAAYTVGWQGGWEVILETDQTLTSSLAYSGTNGTGRVIVRSDTPGQLRTISCTADAATISWFIGGWFQQSEWQDIKFVNTNASKASAWAILASGSGSARGFIFKRCVFGDPSARILGAINVSTSSGITPHFIDCTIQNCVNVAVLPTNIFAVNTVFRNNDSTTSVVQLPSGGVFSNCLFYNNNCDAVRVNFAASSYLATFVNCTFDNNAGDGISNELGAGGSNGLICINCSFTKNTQFGIRSGVVAEMPQSTVIGCNFGTGSDANTLGAFSSSVLERSTVYNDNCYVDRASEDYRPTASLQGKGSPMSPDTLGANQLGVPTVIDIGALQSAGGGVFDPLNHPLIN